MRLLVLLLLFLFCSAAFAQPDDGSFHLAVKALLKAQTFSAQTVDEPEDDSNNPLALRSEHLRPVLVRQSEQLLLPDAVIPLTDEEREELWLQMKAAPYGLDYLGLLLPRRREVFDWAVEQYGGEPSEFPVWLLANDPRWRDELRRRSHQNDEALVALAHLDWEAAQPIVEEMSKDENWFTALKIRFYHPETREQARVQLLKLLQNSKERSYYRAAAANVLLSDRSSDPDQLFLKLLEEPYWSSDHVILDNPVEDYPLANPKWLPRLVKLLDDPRRPVHDNAARGLLTLARYGLRPEALRALLPWLKNPQWAAGGFSERSSLVEAAGELKLAEAVPILVSLVGESEDNSELFSYLTALEAIGDPALEESWRVGMAKASDSTMGANIAEIGIRHGFVSVKEQVEAVGRFAEADHAGKWRESFHTVLGVGPQTTPELCLGLAAAYGKPGQELLTGVIQLASSWLEEGKPELATLEGYIFRWKGPEVDAYLLTRVTKGSVTEEHLTELLNRAKSLREGQSKALKEIASRSDGRGGLVAALLGQKSSTEAVLKRGHTEETLALLAASRYLGTALPLPKLEKLYTSKAELKEAVSAYLDSSQDSAAALLAKKLSGGEGISGRKAEVQEFDEIEADLRKSHRERGGELFALQFHHMGHSLEQVCIEVWMDKEVGELVVRSLGGNFGEYLSGAESYERRAMTREEVASFRQFIDKRSVDSWGEWSHVTSHHFDSYQYLHLSPGHGRRIAMVYNSGWDQGEGEKYQELVALFEKLLEAPSQTVYPFLDELPDARVLLDQGNVSALDADAGGLLALVDKRQWRRLGADGSLGDVIAELPREGRFSAEETDYGVLTSFIELPDGARLVIGGHQVLWESPGKPDRVLAKGKFLSGSVDPTGRRVILRSFADDLASLTLLDIPSAMLHKIDLAPAKELWNLGYLPLHNAFLVVRNEVDEYERPRPPSRCYLVDPQTGKAREVEGEFRPWTKYSGERAPQSAGGTRYWTALPTPLGTEVGTIDHATFKFEPHVHYEGLWFNSSEMWVEGERVYVAIGDVLSLPMRLDRSRSSR